MCRFHGDLPAVNHSIADLLVLDALDEYSENSDDIVNLLLKLIEKRPYAKTRLKICFASSPLQKFLDDFKGASGLNMVDHTKDHIKQLIWNRFQLNARMRECISSSPEMEREASKLQAEICSKGSRCIFLGAPRGR